MRIPLLFLALACSGCLLAGGGEKTRFQEEIRYFVRFESAAGCQDFHAGVRLADRGPYTDGKGFVVLFVAVGGRSVFHETQHYNAQVRQADVDRDGLITDAEAGSYLDGVRAQQGATRKR